MAGGSSRSSTRGPSTASSSSSCRKGPPNGVSLTPCAHLFPGDRAPRAVADYLPLLTAVVAFALTLLLGMQYARRRKLHQLEWTVALGLLGLAAVLAFLGNPDVIGWSHLLYRAYLPLTALPVGLIGLGVLQLFRDRPKLAEYYGVYWVATAIPVIAVTAVASITDASALAAQGPNVGGRYLPAFGAVSWLQTVPGAVVFIGGGVYT